MASTLPDSLWTATATPPSAYPRLEGEERADVCIIGGGFTGLSAALHLAEGGASVVVLEAGVVGSGASGRNGGQVIPGLKHDPGELESEFGAERGARLTELVGGAADFVFGLVRRHRIECDARQDGWIKACHSESALRAASHTAGDWGRRGAAVEAIDRVRIAELTGTDAYIGGFVDHRGGVVQPLSYTRGLARAAQQAGVRIHEGSVAGTPQRGGGQWIVSSATGSVRADKVIIGTNGYTDLAGAQGPWPKLARTVIPVYSYIAATRPLSDDLRRAILPKGQAVSDSRRLLRYFRLDAAGRMVMGGRGRTRESADRSDYANIIASAVELYPQLGGCDWEYRVGRQGRGHPRPPAASARAGPWGPRRAGIQRPRGGDGDRHGEGPGRPRAGSRRRGLPREPAPAGAVAPLAPAGVRAHRGVEAGPRSHGGRPSSRPGLASRPREARRSASRASSRPSARPAPSTA